MTIDDYDYYKNIWNKKKYMLKFKLYKIIIKS